MNYKLYKIKWNDSTSIYGWVNYENLLKHDLEVNSVAFLIKDLEDQIIVSCHISPHCVDAPMCIPKAAIILMEEIQYEQIEGKEDQ